MAIPTYQEIMLPILRLAENGQEPSIQSAVKHLIEHFELTEEERHQRLSGGQRTIYNRTTWAITHLKKAGLLITSRRGYFMITELGEALLAQSPLRVDTRLLNNYPDYRKFTNKEPLTAVKSTGAAKETDKTPEEIMAEISNQLDLQLADDLLEVICKNSSVFFETLVVDLLLKMGYGGLEGAGEVTKKTGDGGIDGIIKQDELGLEQIYIQAKKWEKDATVSRPEIQKFAGALLGVGATKGVFITTACFSRTAMEYAKSVPSAKIVLIEGLTLARLMIKHGLGIGTSNTIAIKKIDSDYFEEQ